MARWLLGWACGVVLAGCSSPKCTEGREFVRETSLCVCPEGTMEAADMSCVSVDGGADAGTDAGFDAAVDGCVERTFYRDSDGDERGDPTMSMSACEAPDGFVEDATDCNDDCNVCWTDNAEACDGEDNDCDGFSDEGLLVPVGEPVPVATTNGDDRAMGAAPLEDGRILVAYTNRAGDALTRIFDPSTGIGTDVGDSFATRQFFFVPPRRAVEPSGIVYQSGSNLVGQPFSSDGTPGEVVALAGQPRPDLPVP
ncbi:MAG: hypothetical protein AAGE52_23110, partial [Myxococcota bacterium]